MAEPIVERVRNLGDCLERRLAVLHDGADDDLGAAPRSRH